MRRSIHHALAPLLLTAAVFLPAPQARGDVPPTITHQGRLFDEAGAPVSDTLEVTFTLYDGAGGGASDVWSETVNVDFDDGYFSVEL